MLESYSLDRYYSEKLFDTIDSFPIIGELVQKRPPQFKQIFRYCRFFKYLPREEIIRRNTYNPWIFFILMGECIVMDDRDDESPVAVLKPGQMFGELDVVFDATGINTVVAEPKSQEVVVLAMNSSVFTAQTTERILEYPTRITLFQAFYHALLARYKFMLEFFRKIGDEREVTPYEPLAFSGDRNSKENVLFFDIETKKLGTIMNTIRHELTGAMITTDEGVIPVKTFAENTQFNRMGINAFLNDLPFRIPETKDRDEDQDIFTELEREEKKTHYTIHELSFLVVDDDEHHRNNAVKILHDLGARKIHVERDGMAAWKFICAHSGKIDIILCDWVMPEMTGLDLFRNIKSASDHLNELIFIMITSIESRTSVVDAVESGVHGYVLKPMTQKHLLKQIQQALKHVRGATLKV